jgi:GNAT superfamily N-acetyltransferase
MLGLLQAQWKAGSTYADSFVTRYMDEWECMVMVNGDLTEVTDEIIEREIEYHRSLGRSFEWKLFSCDLPSDLLECLTARGFEVGIKEVVCAMDISEQLPSAFSPINVKRVQTEDELRDFRSVAEEVFQKDFSYTTAALAKCIADRTEDQVGFVAYDGVTPVSIGRVDHFERAACAGLYSGGTLPEYRGRGFYQAVVAARAKYAKEKGASIIWVDARPTSLPILERLGFTPILESWPCEYEVKI